MTNRFFVASDTIKENEFIITDMGLVHQMSAVLRFKIGEHLELLDNSGHVYVCQVDEMNKKQIRGKILEKNFKPDQPKHKINLCLALLKRDNTELVLQKATELGICEFTPIIADRCIKKISDIPARWQAVVREAAEQCGRTTLPAINEIITFTDCVKKFSPGLICSAGAPAPLSGKNIIENINLYIGPEGDFTPEEIEMALQNKIEPINLGSNILRAETAAIAAVVLINL